MKNASGGQPGTSSAEKEKNMSNKMRFLSRLAVLIAMAAWLLAPAAPALAGDKPGPLLFSPEWDAKNGGALLGGFDTEASVDIYFFPIKVGDEVISGAGDECPNVGEGAQAHTDLLAPGTRLVFYTPGGEQIATAVSGKLSFTCLEASGQILLEPELTEVTEKLQHYTGFALGMREDAAFAGVPTDYDGNKDGSFFLSAKDGGLSVLFKPVQEEGEDLLAGILRRNGQEKEIFLTPASANEVITSNFIDLNADGKFEFFMVTAGVAGVVAVYSADVNSEDNSLFLLDLGE
jgi:hypothetical protein